MCVLLGLQILTLSRVPEQDPTFPYIVILISSLISEQLPLRIRTCHLGNLSLVFTCFTSVHLLISHPSLVPPIFLSVCLDFPWTSFGLAFHLIISVPARIVFKSKPCICSSSESILLLSVPFCPSCSPPQSKFASTCVICKATGVYSGLQPSGPSDFGLPHPLQQYL